MDDVDRSIMRRKSLKERLGFKGIVCCGGATWGISSTTVSVMDEDEENTTGPLGPEIEPINNDTLSPIENGPASPCVQRSPATTGMNLATALAAERQFRASLDSGSPSPQRPNSNEESSGPSPQRPNSNAESANGEGTVPGTPARVSLLKLLEEADGNYGRDKKEDDMEGNMVCDSMCCVCMGRKKGAAFIPCGHTFCRVCSRELWLNRGSCPLCNRLILEILDIY